MRSWALPPGLPAGRLVVPGQSAEGGQADGDPVLWVSEEPQDAAGQLWAGLLEKRAETGLWPLLLLGVHVSQRIREMVPAELVRQRAHRPWHTGELEPAPIAGIADVDAGRVLARWWREVVTGTGEEAFDFGGDELPKAPFREWPGLAPPVRAATDPDLAASRILRAPERLLELTGRADPPFIGLVPAMDGATAIAACGWPSSAVDILEAAAVVRSWQDRFGVRACVLGIDKLVMTVAWPPGDLQEARRVAAEHLAFRKSFESGFDEYARALIGGQVWFFWWD